MGCFSGLGLVASGLATGADPNRAAAAGRWCRGRVAGLRPAPGRPGAPGRAVAWLDRLAAAAAITAVCADSGRHRDCAHRPGAVSGAR